MMAYFAKLDDQSVVTDVMTVNDEEVFENGVLNEDKGIAFLTVWSNGYYKWRYTTEDGSARKNYAGIGFSYDSILDAFIPEKPYPSWLLNTNTCQWQAPVPYPNDGNLYIWDEATQSWVEVTT